MAQPDAHPDADTADATTGAPDRFWRCRKCAHAITTQADRCEIDGRHVHLRLNPHAVAFLFGCFSSARGVSCVGPPTAEATWFAGCLWEYAMCANCGTHLGWRFSGSASFVGLVLERLVDPDG